MIPLIVIVAALAAAWAVAIVVCSGGLPKKAFFRGHLFWLSLSGVTGTMIFYGITVLYEVEGTIVVIPVMISVIVGLPLAIGLVTCGMRMRVSETDIGFTLPVIVVYWLSAVLLAALYWAFPADTVTWVVTGAAGLFAVIVLGAVMPAPPENPIKIDKPALRKKSS